jgi:hypothetical protein
VASSFTRWGARFRRRCLLVPQCVHRIDLGRFARRQVSCADPTDRGHLTHLFQHHRAYIVASRAQPHDPSAGSVTRFQSNQGGALPDFHLMLQPTLGS